MHSVETALQILIFVWARDMQCDPFKMQSSSKEPQLLINHAVKEVNT